MKLFYMDIESIPDQRPGAIEEIAATIQAPGTYKKPESIQQWLDENRMPMAREEWLKTSFDGGAGHLFCVSWAVGDGKPRCISVSNLGINAERVALVEFFDMLAFEGHVRLVGHNIIGFDLPFLWKRAMVLGVKPPPTLPRNVKPWSELVEDTMLLWDANQRHGGSMDRICKLMGIPGKQGMSGADVWPAVERGEYALVEEYCMADVERTRAMHKRMTFA